MKDKLLQMMFEHERWEQLLEKSVDKGIDKTTILKMCEPENRVRLYREIKNNTLEFIPAHQAQIPKDEPGEFRTVYVGEPIERIVCSLINDCLFELFPEMVHSACKSYQKGIGCSKVVTDLSKIISKKTHVIVGGKYDIHHYFDEIKRDKIMGVFDLVEDKLGFERNTEPVVNLLRRIWNNDLMFDIDGNLIEKWSGIRQGNAIGSWLADVMLYELDEFMTNKYEYYVRYSDDMIVICDDVNQATNDINNIIQKYGVRLNPKKVETITKDRWFKFLGYSICENKISISKGRLKKFQKEIMSRTVNKRDISFLRAVNSINTYLYKGNGEYAWAKQILGTVNVEEDVELMNEFILDCLRAVQTGKKKVGGLGYVTTNKKGVVVRGIGKNVKANRLKTQKDIPEYYSLGMMRKALITDKSVYNTLVAQL